MTAVVLLAAGCSGSTPEAPSTSAEPPSSPSASTPEPLASRCPAMHVGPEPGTIQVTTSDGVHLYAAVFGSGTTGIVMANDVPHDICEEVPEAQLLAAKGFRVAVFDYRDRGASGPAGANPGRLDLDVAAVAQELRGLGSSCLVLAGSYGGVAASILAALERPRPAALIGFSPAVLRGQYIQGPFGPEGALQVAPRLRVPALYVTERSDGFLPVGEVRRLLRVTGSADKRLIVTPPTLAGWSLLDVGRSSPRVEAAVLSLIRSSCA